MNAENSIFKETSEIIINECRVALSKIDPDSVTQLIDVILSADKVFFVGIGRVMLSLQAMVKRMSHLGINTFYVGQITEPAITDKDLLIIGSGSGESLIPIVIARKAKLIGARIAHVGSNPESSLKEVTDIFVRIPVRTKIGLSDEIYSEQPMTSLFEQSLLLLGDVIAKMIIIRKNLKMSDLWQYHANLE